MPLRIQISDDTDTWSKLVQQTFGLEREALPFQRYPLAHLQQEIGLGQPLFETVFNYVNFHVYQDLSSVEHLEEIGFQGFEQTNFALLAQYSVNPITTEISLHLTYDSKQFDSEQVTNIGDYYHKVLVSMVTQPEERHEEVCLLSQADRQLLLVEWNDTESEYPRDKCIHQLFEEQVEKNPNAIAVTFERQQLTYRELNQKANQLAHHLLSLGVKAETLVGICVERSLEMVIGLLGILKAGGAYVPLDPNYPAERLIYMLDDAQVSILLTQSSLVQSLPQHSAQVVCLDSDWVSIKQQSTANYQAEIDTANLVYVIYTSGSTGNPKGGNE